VKKSLNQFTRHILKKISEQEIKVSCLDMQLMNGTPNSCIHTLTILLTSFAKSLQMLDTVVPFLGSDLTANHRSSLSIKKMDLTSSQLEFITS